MANSYLQKNESDPQGNRTTATISVWIKRTLLGAEDCFFSHYYNGSNYFHVRFNTNNTMNIESYAGASQQQVMTTNRVFRDTSAWYHILLALDSTQGTDADRLKLYVNGTQETSFSAASYVSQNANYVIDGGAGYKTVIGNRGGSSSDLDFNGYMSHYSYVQGTALTPTSFGETDSTSGIWKFKSPSGITWGSKGYHLKFENSAALGTDSSGNSNTFTVNGNLKQSLDTPSNVHATLNALDDYYQADTLSNGNLTMTGGGQYAPRTATLGLTTGKWYWEIQTNNFQASDGSAFGISSQMATASNYEYYNQSGANVGYGYFSNGSGYGNNGAIFTGYGTGSGTHIIGVALNLDDNKIAWSYDGAWQGSTDPSSGNTNMISITAPSSLTWYLYRYKQERN